MKPAVLAVAAAFAVAAAAPAAAPRAIQHGAAQGIRVTVYSSGRAIFDLRHAEPTPRRLLTGPHGLAYGCMRVRLLRGTWRGGEYTLNGRFRPTLRFRWQNLRAPYDGCELGGLYGHRWNDAFGTRNAVEIWLTPTGRHFFNDRAAARDLAYFVRSKRVQKIRLSVDPRPGLEAFERRYPGRVVEIASPLARVRKDQVGFWIGPRTIVFTVTSSTGRRLYVVAERGTLKLPQKNLGHLAFVF